MGFFSDTLGSVAGAINDAATNTLGLDLGFQPSGFESVEELPEISSIEEEELIGKLLESVDNRIENDDDSPPPDNPETAKNNGDLPFWERNTWERATRFSNEEAEAIYEELKKDTDQLKRILTSCKRDIKEATNVFVDQVKFIAEYKPKSVTPENIPNSLPSGAWRLNGYSKDGCVVSVFDLAIYRPDDYGENENEAVDEYIRMCAYMNELMLASVPKDGSCIVVLDLSQFDVSWISRGTCQRMVSEFIWMGQTVYPERMQKCLVLDAPLTFTLAWTMIKPMLPARTISKISFIKQEQLTDFIDPSVLIRKYGGTHEEYPIPSKTVKEEKTTFISIEEDITENKIKDNISATYNEDVKPSSKTIQEEKTTLKNVEEDITEHKIEDNNNASKNEDVKPSSEEQKHNIEA